MEVHEDAKMAYKMIYRASLHQVISKAMLLTVQTYDFDYLKSTVAAQKVTTLPFFAE